MNHQDWLDEVTDSRIPMYSQGNPIAYDNCAEDQDDEQSPPTREEAVFHAYWDINLLIEAIDSENLERMMTAREVALWSLSALTQAFPEVFKDGPVVPPPADEDDDIPF